MATKPTSPKYNGQTSKSDEIAALREFRAQFSDSTYTASFLSEKAIEYFVQNVKDDFSPDIYETVEIARRETAAAEKNAARLSADLEKANQTIASREREISAQQETIDRLINENAGLRRQVRELSAASQDADARAEIAEADAAEKTAVLTAEINRLKVMIFDLEHSAK